MYALASKYFKRNRDILRGSKESATYIIKDSPLDHAPNNENELRLLFNYIADPVLGLHIERAQVGYPDYTCKDKGTGKVIGVEAELKSSHFIVHEHKSSGCKIIACWHNDLPNDKIPKGIEILSLELFEWISGNVHFGGIRNVWVQPAEKSQWQYLNSDDVLEWKLSKNAKYGDICLLYRRFPLKKITDVFYISGKTKIQYPPKWGVNKGIYGDITRVCRLKNAITLEEMQKHENIKNSPFVRKNMQGIGRATEYWADIQKLIYTKNPGSEKSLKNSVGQIKKMGKIKISDVSAKTKNNQYVRTYPDGTKNYIRNGELHRIEGPAKIWPDGGKEYYQNGKLHREDGPAIDYPRGPCGSNQKAYKEWALFGERFENEKQFKECIKKIKNQEEC